MENEEIMMNETSTEEMVPQEETDIVENNSAVEDCESSEGNSAAAVALVGAGAVMAVVGTVHVVKTYVVPAVAKGVSALKQRFGKNKIIEGEVSEEPTEEAENIKTE